MDRMNDMCDLAMLTLGLKYSGAIYITNSSCLGNVCASHESLSKFIFFTHIMLYILSRYHGNMVASQGVIEFAILQNLQSGENTSNVVRELHVWWNWVARICKQHLVQLVGVKHSLGGRLLQLIEELVVMPSLLVAMKLWQKLGFICDKSSTLLSIMNSRLMSIGNMQCFQMKRKEIVEMYDLGVRFMMENVLQECNKHWNLEVDL
jgi:hypothetical protein